MSRARRRWSESGGLPGAMVSHPTVIAEAGRDRVGTRPQLREHPDLTVVTYSRTRVHLDRDAWEMLPPGGVLVMHVCPAGAEPFVLALAADELDAVFGEVRESDSWRDARYYNFPSVPKAAARFRVRRPAAIGASPSPKESSSVSGRPSSRPATAFPPPRSGIVAVELPPEVARRDTSGRASPVAVPAGASRLDWAHAWFEHLGDPGESDAYLTSVEQWRLAWRPERVKVLLVAESHVGQAPGDESVRLRLPATLTGRIALPDSYVRLIYCLGYGDDPVCRPRPVSNRGTPDFWDIFGLIATEHRQPSGLSQSRGGMIAWRVSVLQQLRERGIWLQDASPVGIYRPGGHTLTADATLRRHIFREGYRRFIWPEVEAERPERVWVIGRTVGRALAGMPGVDASRVVSQAGWARRAGQMPEHWAEVKRMAEDIAAVAP